MKNYQVGDLIIVEHKAYEIGDHLDHDRYLGYSLFDDTTKQFKAKDVSSMAHLCAKCGDISAISEENYALMNPGDMCAVCNLEEEEIANALDEIQTERDFINSEFRGFKRMFDLS